MTTFEEIIKHIWPAELPRDYDISESEEDC